VSGGTRNPDRDAAFQEMLGLARHSFLSYVIESSSPVVVDEADRRLMRLFEEIYERERHYVERGYELLDRSGLRPMPPTYRLTSSNFNFLRPVKLAEHWVDQVALEVKRLEALRSHAVPGDPVALDFMRLLDDLVALRRESLKRVADLRAEVTAVSKS
jgi:hypothetical protein